MESYIAIALGGAIGAVCRFALSNQVYQWLGREFPWGTLVVNVVGSFLMGFLLIHLTYRLQVHESFRHAILVGFLGALTTFSTFSIDNLQLLEQGALLKAGLNMLLNVAICLIAVYAGTWLARQL